MQINKKERIYMEWLINKTTRRHRPFFIWASRNADAWLKTLSLCLRYDQTILLTTQSLRIFFCSFSEMRVPLFYYFRSL